MEPIRRSNRRVLAFLLALLLCVTLLPAAALAKDDTTAASVRLVGTEGTVTVKDASGNVKTIRADMRLYSGYTVVTAAKSYAWLSLDDSKSIKLDASTAVQVRKSGMKLEVLLQLGNLFFGVSKPLEANETLNIRTSTMVCGIRGTHGEMHAIDALHSEILMLTGVSRCTVTDPETGNTRTDDVAAGESASCYVDDGAAVGNNAHIVKNRVHTGDVRGFAQKEIVADDALVGQILGETDGNVDLTGVTPEDADARQKQDEDEDAKQQEILDDLQNELIGGGDGPTPQPVKPVWDDEPVPEPVEPVDPVEPTVRSYTVTFDANGGTGSMAPLVVRAGGGTKQVPACAFTREGWHFTGWNTAADGSGTAYSVGSPLQEPGAATATSFTLYAQWEKDEAETFTITWMNDDGTVLATDSVEKGTVPQYSGETPTKAATAQYTYTFSGWTPELAPAAEDATYTAVYSETLNRFTITWCNDDGTVLATDTVDYGTVPAYSGETPTKAATDNLVYTFTGWTPEVVAATADAAYTATYSSDTRTFSVTIPNDLEHGTVTASPTESAVGGTITLTVTPDEGYSVQNVYYKETEENTMNSAAFMAAAPNYAAGDAADGWIRIEPTNGVYSFAMPAAPVTVWVDFVRMRTLSLSVDGSGTVTVNGEAHADGDTLQIVEGDTVTVAAEPADGWALAVMMAYDSGENELSVADGQFTMPEDDAVLAVRFGQLYSITVAERLEHGTVSAAPAEALEGETVTLTVTPDENCAIAEVWYMTDGDKRTTIEPENDSYTFEMPAGNVTVGAEFTPSYLLTVQIENGEDGGTVTVDGSAVSTGDSTRYPEGTELTVQATPATGWTVSAVAQTGDAEAVELDGTDDHSYTLTVSGDDMTVTLTFEMIDYSIGGLDALENGTAQLLVNGEAVDDLLTATAHYGDEITVVLTGAEPAEWPSRVTPPVYMAESLSGTAGEEELEPTLRMRMVEEYEYTYNSTSLRGEAGVSEYAFTMPAADVALETSFVEPNYLLITTETMIGANPSETDLSVPVSLFLPDADPDADEPLASGEINDDGGTILIPVLPGEAFLLSLPTQLESSDGTYMLGQAPGWPMIDDAAPATAESETGPFSFVIPESTNFVADGNTRNMTLTLTYALAHTIHFDLVDPNVAGELADITYLEGYPMTLPDADTLLTDTQRETMYFDGWIEPYDNEVLDSGTYEEFAVIEDITFTAQWKYMHGITVTDTNGSMLNYYLEDDEEAEVDGFFEGSTAWVYVVLQPNKVVDALRIVDGDGQEIEAGEIEYVGELDDSVTYRFSFTMPDSDVTISFTSTYMP